ncbi:hypothetical protein [Candidatus Berkiella aquae]|uniref:Uncharacterized protein n=1 Tax=Candidatus Berkiella aquae TaxID=295108 RepID=A0A0Q9YR48_9GAMM|nr:hypothetical protein [Candidatus Berkiella aquae]MCS5709900.1 hypothetical protein [Candidatus Berkiella aquae]
MFKNKFIFLFTLCSLAMSSTFAANNPNNPPPPSMDNIATQAYQACEASKEGAGCMYIKDDTKFTGTCQKHEGKLHCRTIKD